MSYRDLTAFEQGLGIELSEDEREALRSTFDSFDVLYGPYIVQADHTLGKTALCCDGPLNGRYATAAEAQVAGYTLDRWPSGEPVWVERHIDPEREAARVFMSHTSDALAAAAEAFEGLGDAAEDAAEQFRAIRRSLRASRRRGLVAA